MFGKVLFLTVYAFILVFLFLPSSFLENKLIRSLAATYVVTEEELKSVVRQRKKTIRKLNKVMLMNKLVVQSKADVFCVDIALHLLNVAFESYYDPVGFTTTSGYGPMNLDRHDFTLIDMIYEKAHDTFCIIARHKINNKLVVSFRGTTSKQHWKNNLNYGKKDVDLIAMDTSILDAVDGLEVTGVIRPEIENLTAGDFDSEDDDANDDEDEEDNNDNVNEIGEDHRSSFGRKESLQVGGARDDRTSILVGGSEFVNQGVQILGKATTTVGKTVGIVLVSAAKITPVLGGLVKPHVHSGFFDAYFAVRNFVHAVVRRELKENPAPLLVTGHSLGGKYASSPSSLFFSFFIYC